MAARRAWLWDELLAGVAEAAAGSPSEAAAWCRASRGLAAACQRRGLWEQVVGTLRWPPSSRAAGARILAAYARLGVACRSLLIDGHRGDLRDLPLLSERCPAVRSLAVTGVGAQGLDCAAWKAWGASLKHVSLAFFYDAVDGPPAIREVLLGMGAHCAALTSLAVSGMDWLTAREACVAALAAAAPGLPGLVRLELAGSEARMSEEATLRLARLWPGLVVRVDLRASANLDW